MAFDNIASTSNGFLPNFLTTFQNDCSRLATAAGFKRPPNSTRDQDIAIVAGRVFSTSVVAFMAIKTLSSLSRIAITFLVSTSAFHEIFTLLDNIEKETGINRPPPRKISSQEPGEKFNVLTLVKETLEHSEDYVDYLTQKTTSTTHKMIDSSSIEEPLPPILDRIQSVYRGRREGREYERITYGTFFPSFWNAVFLKMRPQRVF